MIYCIDLDNTLCTQESDYSKAKPIQNRIDIVNELFNKGNIIKIFTGRGVSTGIDWVETTRAQLKKWDVKHHELLMGIKPHCHYFVDDKAIPPNKFFSDNFNEE